MAALIVGLGPATGAAAQAIGDPVNRLYRARNVEGRVAAAEALRDDGLSAAELMARLQAGPTYADDVATGLLEEVHFQDGQAFPYLLRVPEAYDPGQPHPVRFFLHGGIRRPEWDAGGGWWRRMELVAGEEYIAVMPAAWDQHPWWRYSHLASFGSILGRIKRDYNVDENRVALLGISDGGSGVYFFATRGVTPWASFLPLIGHPAVLFNPRLGVDGETYPVNLRNRPLYIVNGENDRLYPTRTMEPFVAELLGFSVPLRYRPIPGGGHDVDWWPEEEDGMEAFIRENPRDPDPDSIWWETDDPDRSGRAYWVVIEELGAVAGEARFPGSLLFPSEHPSGRVHAVREGNVIRLRTEGVARLRVLLSWSGIDFTEPVTVYANGTLIADGTVSPDPDVTLRWAVRDLDRTSLYAGEIEVRIPHR